MTIEQFNNHEFSRTDIAIYKGKEYSIISVDFEDKLIGINEFKDGLASWKRCENVDVFKSNQSN